MDAAQPLQPTLSPPWITLYNKILNTIGADPTFTVQAPSDQGDSFVIRIASVGGGSSPYGLAGVLKPRYSMGNITVQVQVLDPSGKPIAPQLPSGADPVGAVVMAVGTGLAKNPYLVTVVNTVGKFPPGYSMPQVEVVFTKSIIQFYNDDMTDLYGNFNGITADVFEDILTTEYPGNVRLGTSTQSTVTEGGGTQGTADTARR